MPRFRLPDSYHLNHSDDLDPDEHHGHDEIDELHERFDSPAPARRRAPRAADPRPLVVVEGRSGRRTIDADTVDTVDTVDTADSEPDAAPGPPADRTGLPTPDDPIDSPFSSYDVATRGPRPTPDWLITALSARDTRLGPLKSGKEADVELLERAVPGGPGCLLAVKTFRDAHHRMFHRDAAYQEGRRVRRSRETRAMAARTGFGRELLAGKWATAEFGALSRLWSAGARVPYPVQLIGTEVMMEFIGEPDGTAAPRLAALDASTAEFTDLWHDLVGTLEILAESGLTHGDLSPYNVLVDDTRCVVIDLPQVVDLVANPAGADFLARDCRNIAGFFARRGVLAADPETLALRLTGLALP